MMTSRLSGRSLAAVVERLQPNSSLFSTSNFRQMSTVKVSTPPKKPANNLVPPTKLVEKVTTAKPSSLDNEKKKKESVQHFKCPKCDFTDESRNNVKQHIISEHKTEPYGCPFCPAGFTNFTHLNKHIKQSHSGKTQLKEPYELVEVGSSSDKEISKPSNKSEKLKSEQNPPMKLASEDPKSSTKVPTNKKSVDKKIDSVKSSKTDSSTRSRSIETQHATKKISGVHLDDVIIPGPSNVGVSKAATKNDLKVFSQIKSDVFVPDPPQTKVSVSKPPAKNELEKLEPNKPGSLSPLLDIHTGSSLTPILPNEAWMKEQELRNKLLKNPRPALLQVLYPMKAFSALQFANHLQLTEKVIVVESVEKSAVPPVDHSYRQNLIENSRGGHLFELYPMKSFDKSNFDQISNQPLESARENNDQDDVLSTMSNYMKNVRDLSVEYLKSFGVNLGAKK